MEDNSVTGSSNRPQSRFPHLNRAYTRARNQGKLVTELPATQKSQAEQFMRGLGLQDHANVSGLLRVVDKVARTYLASEDVDRIAEFTRRDGGERIPIPFFSVYAVGGTITKIGDRPDIDIMTATNMRYFSDEELDQVPAGELHSKPTRSISEELLMEVNAVKERLLAPLLASFRVGFNQKIFGTLPFSYNSGDVEHKLLVRFTPKEYKMGKPIDFIYVNTGHTTFVSEEEFLALDVDQENKPLPRLLLYKAFLNGYVHPPLDLHLD